MFRWFIYLFQQTSVYRWLIMSVLPYLGFRIWGNPKFPMANYFEIRKRIRENPGAIWVFVGVNKLACSYLLNKMFTGAKWSHAGFLELGGDGEVRCKHMMAPGFCDWYLLDYLKEVDGFEIFPIGCTDILLARKRLEQVKDARPGYDYDFDLGMDLKKLYCSEMVWWVLRDLTPGLSPHTNLGRKMFEPDDLWELMR